jgi:hypothetical protein
VATTILLLRTSCTNPGFITADAPPDVDRKYCQACALYVPADAGHCRDCGVCIAKLDHHCPWMSKCVGSGNMSSFMLFNVTWILYVLFVLLTLAIDSKVFG